MIKIINIKKEERSQILILMAMFFCIVGSSITGASARDTFFLTQFDKSLLPLMFAFVAGLMVIVITIYNRIAANIDLVKTIIFSSIFFCITLFIIRANLNGFVIPIFYAWIDVIISITIFQFWLLAGEIFNSRQAKRLYSIIGIGGSVAGISAGYFMRPFVKEYGAKELLVPTILMIALMAIFASLLNSFRVKKVKSSRDKVKNNSSKTVFDPYLKSILIMVCAAAICSRIIEFQFKITAANTYSSPEQLAAFFGDYYMYLNGTTLLMQLFLTGFILHRFGILGGLIIMPLGLIIGSVSFLTLANLSGIFIARLFDQSFKFSIQSASNEMLWTTVPKEKSRKAKPIIDSSIKSIAEGIVGLTIYFIIAQDLLKDDQIYLLSAPVIFIILIWLANNFRIKKKYILSIEKAINHRHLNISEIQIDHTDNHFIKTINETLESDDINQQLFAVELIKDLEMDQWRQTLNKLLLTDNPILQKQILLLAFNRKSIIDKKVLIQLSNQKNEIGALGITFLADDNIREEKKRLYNNINSSDTHISAASSVAILRIEPENKLARKRLDEFLDVKDEDSTAIALDYLKNSSELLTRDLLNNLLHHPSTKISKSALNVSGERLDAFYMKAIISNLENVKCAQDARRVLKNFKEKTVISNLKTELQNRDINKNLKKGILYCLSEYSNGEVIKLIKNQINKNDLDMSIAAADALLKIAKRQSHSFPFNEYFFETVNDFANQYFRLFCFKLSISNTTSATLIVDQIANEMEKILYIVLKLVTLSFPNSPIDSHIKNIIAGNDEDLPYILEFFDTTFDKNTRKILMPIVDPESDYKEKSIKKEQKKNPIKKWLKLWSESTNQWKSAISVDYLLKNENDDLPYINWDSINATQIISEIFIKHKDLNKSIPLEKFQKQTEKTMFTILEKTILLKTVDLFQNIPGELLSQVSQISKARNFAKDETVFKEGDSGDSMFIVIKGRVAITKGDKEIASLEKGASLGEMALLDHEERSANAIAKEDSVLLKINQDVFYELMESNADIMKQIIKLLTSRIRNVNARLEESLK